MEYKLFNDFITLQSLLKTWHPAFWQCHQGFGRESCLFNGEKKTAVARENPAMETV